jgi:hypothetical protein
MAKKSEKTPKKKRKGGLGSQLTVLFLVLGIIVGLRQSSVILLIGILPSAVAYFVDETPRRSWFKTVLAFNLAGVVPYLMEVFFMHANNMEAVQTRLGDFSMWAIMYLFAAMGWMTIWLCPKLVHIGLRVYYDSRIDHHKTKLKEVEQQYGLEES